MTTCRCQDCQNKVGNEKREKLISKAKKKDEDKESLALAAFAISGTDHAEMPAVTNIGGVSANTVAMVSAGIAAAGVDVFLPAGSYARPMLDGSGRAVDEIAFGVVGRQDVGGVEEDSASQALNKLKVENLVAPGASNPILSIDLIGALPGRSSTSRTDLQARWAVLTQDVGLHHESFKSILMDTSMGTTRTSCMEDSSEMSKPVSAIAADSVSVSVGTNTESSKRTHEQFARETIDNIMSNVNDLKKSMDSMNGLARRRIDELLEKKNGVVEQDINSGASSEKSMGRQPIKDEDMDIESQPVENSLLCKEEFPAGPRKEALPESAIKELYSLASQDTALYNELSRVIRERALELAKARKEKAKQP